MKQNVRAAAMGYFIGSIPIAHDIQWVVQSDTAAHLAKAP